MKTHRPSLSATAPVARRFSQFSSCKSAAGGLCFGALALLLIPARIGAADTAASVAVPAVETVKSAPPVTTLRAFKRVVGKDAKGKAIETLVPFTKVLPGEEVVYVLSTNNPGTEPVTDIAVTLPVPPEMTYAVGSAETVGAQVSFSVDGGKTFTPIDRLLVVAPDGASRPGLVEDINQVRWLINQPLAPGGSFEVRLRATLK